MTEDERQAIESATITARAELDTFVRNLSIGAELADLYDQAKPVHTSALGIWCAVVDILRAHQGLNQREPKEDEINFEELFGKENADG